MDFFDSPLQMFKGQTSSPVILWETHFPFSSPAAQWTLFLCRLWTLKLILSQKFYCQGQKAKLLHIPRKGIKECEPLLETPCKGLRLIFEAGKLSRLLTRLILGYLSGRVDQPTGSRCSLRKNNKHEDQRGNPHTGNLCVDIKKVRSRQGYL